MTTRTALLCCLQLLITGMILLSGEAVAETTRSDHAAFDLKVQPILAEFCFGCHADGAEEGSLSFDSLRELKDEHEVKETWHRVLKQLRSELMPPPAESQPTESQIETLESWIIGDALGIDVEKPDPGKVTVRRLNRVEYRNTIRDLIGVDYNTSFNFPADNTGHGFDNIADVLTISPLLLEKYFDSANQIISSVVPTNSGTMREHQIVGSSFRLDPQDDASEPESNEAEQVDSRRNRSQGRRRGRRGGDRFELSYYEPATARASTRLDISGEYQVRVSLDALEDYVDNVFDQNRCEFTLSLDGEELIHEPFVRQGGKEYTFEFDRTLGEGDHEVVVTLTPLSNEEQVRRLRIRVNSIAIVGPKDAKHFVKPKGYERFFPRDVPSDADGRRQYAKELLRDFADRAFRRPVEDETANRLTALAEGVYQNGETFEAGIAKSMTAILASPRFIFREEFPLDADSSKFPFIDEFSLASRLSYFLWSSMPDAELMRLANEGKLRENLDTQVQRMLDDQKSNAFVANFAGQWLRARDIESIQISARSVLRRESKPDPEADQRRQRFFELFRKGDDRTEEENAELEVAREEFRRSFGRGPQVDLTGDVRRAMRQETEMLFEFVIKNDRSLLEIVDSDYTFLNKTLAEHYQIEDIEDLGGQMQRVQLPADSVRGGVLTQGTTLVVTSNPDRTSPVKRGLYVLENLLGMPTAAPPPNIPALEDVDRPDDSKPLSLRETLAVHRADVLCSSCHNRMDPLGLAMENFNALGRFREQEFGQDIDPSGELITGEAFTNIQQLKKILVTTRRREVYRCMAEKMMTYALGRSVELGDIPTIDQIVNELDQANGRSSILLRGIIHSPAFQRTSR